MKAKVLLYIEPPPQVAITQNKIYKNKNLNK